MYKQKQLACNYRWTFENGETIDFTEILKKISDLQSNINIINNNILDINLEIDNILNSLDDVDVNISDIKRRLTQIESKLSFLENIQKISTREVDLTLDNTIVIDLPFGFISDNLTILSVMVYNVEKLTIEPLTNYTNCKFKILTNNKLTFTSTATGASFGGMSDVIFTISKY